MFNLSYCGYTKSYVEWSARRRVEVAGSNLHGKKSSHAKGWCGPSRVRTSGDFDGLNAPRSQLLKPQVRHANHLKTHITSQTKKKYVEWNSILHLKSAWSWNLSKPIKRWVKNTIKKKIFFPSKTIYLVINIIILNTIDSFTVDIDRTFFVLMHIFNLKISLMFRFQEISTKSY